MPIPPPLISVVMPVWNGEQYVEEAVQSVLDQTFTDFEFIVVDDGSTDRTPEILQSFSDPRLIIHQLDHGGIVTALNYGVGHARADWIARHDADDICVPRRLEIQWAALQKNPQAVLCFSDVELMREKPAVEREARLTYSRAFAALRLCYYNPYGHNTVVYRRSALIAAGGYRQEERHAEDFGLWGRMLKIGSFVCVAEKLVKQRVHAQSASQKNLSIQKDLAEKIAISHCQDYMQLSAQDARRAFQLLRLPAHERSWADWAWFVTKCVPRLRWQSIEIWAWLFFQTLKQVRLGIAGRPTTAA